MIAMDVQSNQTWSTISTTPSWHHFHLTVTKKCKDPALAVLWCKGALICLCTSLKGATNILHMITMDLRSHQRWSTASTMPSWHHFHPIPIVTQNCQNLTQLQWCNSVRVHLYAYTPHWKVLQTCYICPRWMWEAIKGGLQPQPWHHGIITTRQSPRIAKILPSVSSGTV